MPNNNIEHIEKQRGVLKQIIAELEKKKKTMPNGDSKDQLTREIKQLSHFVNEYRRLSTENADVVAIIALDQTILNDPAFKAHSPSSLNQFLSEALDFIAHNKRIVLGVFLILLSIPLLAMTGPLGFPAVVAGALLMSTGFGLVAHRVDEYASNKLSQGSTKQNDTLFDRTVSTTPTTGFINTAAECKAAEAEVQKVRENQHQPDISTPHLGK